MATSNKLEQEAIAARERLIPKNTYNNSDQSQEYNVGNANALSDGDIKGKGTGVFMDTFNGGGDFDINGNPVIAGSGRIANQAKNEYDEDNRYVAPDTTANVGQVIIGG